MAELLMLTGAYGPFIHAGGRNRQGKRIELAHPDTFGLWTSLDGAMTVDLGGTEPLQRLPGPAVVFITPGPRRVVSVAGGGEWYYLRFDLVDQPRRRRTPNRQAWCHDGPVTQPTTRAIWGCDPPVMVPEFLQAGAIQLLRDCCALWWRNDHYHAQANAALGSWLMDYVIHSTDAAQSRATGRGLHQQCRELIHERLGLGIDVADLAEACGYSRVHFSRLFRQVTGMAPGYFIREERLAQACHLLISSDANLAEIAGRCGYRSVSAFSRTFTDNYGKPPGSWRRRYR